MQHKGNFSFKDNKTTFIRQNKFNPKQGKKDFSFTPHEQLTTIACIMLLLAQHTLGAKEIPVDEALPNGFVPLNNTFSENGVCPASEKADFAKPSQANIFVPTKTSVSPSHETIKKRGKNTQFASF